MRTDNVKVISWAIVAIVVIAALWVMWICPGIIAKTIITVAVIVSLVSALKGDFHK